MKKKILIIDDEIDLCFLLKSYLTAKNYEVDIANNIKDGLIKLDFGHPDILFLDNNLPDGLGWEQAPEISFNNPALKINLISGLKQSYPPEKIKNNIRIMEKPLSAFEIDKALL
jgi:DNA-binding response OmpR family regulator